MAKIPAEVKTAWENREGPIVLATVDENATPNIIYATCVAIFGEERFVVADNYFDKTRKNIQNGGTGSMLFIDKDGKAYQAKGELEYHTSGEVYDDMQSWNPEKHPGHAAAALKVEAIYSGAEKIC